MRRKIMTADDERAASALLQRLAKGEARYVKAETIEGGGRAWKLMVAA